MNSEEGAPSVESIPCPLDDADESVVEYIDYLHDRIQFLTEELEEAERELLTLREQEPGSGRPGSGESEVETDIENISGYVRYLAYEFETDQKAAKRYVGLLGEVLEEEIEDGEDLGNASLALWALLKQHEELASS